MRAKHVVLHAVALMGLAAALVPNNASAACQQSTYHWRDAGPNGNPSFHIWYLDTQLVDCDGNPIGPPGPICCGQLAFPGAGASSGNCPTGGVCSTDCKGVNLCPDDGDIATDTCGDFNCVPGTGLCDGVGQGGGCWNSDEKACSAAGRDAHPLVFSTGQVSSQPITLLSLDGVQDLPLSYVVRYDSRNPRVPSFTQHFLGLGWTDNYSDRLVANGSTTYEWSSIEGTITFLSDDATHFHSRGLDYRLTDNGVGASPRFTIVSARPYEIHRVWTFTYRTDAQQNSWGELSSRQAAGYTQIITRLSDGRIDTVTDNIGRTLKFGLS